MSIPKQSLRPLKDLLHSMCKITGMEEKKSCNLLKKIDLIQKIARVKNPKLSDVLGANLARGVEDFFRKKNTL